MLTSGKTKQFQVDGVEVRYHSCWQLPRSFPLTTRYARQISISILRAISKEKTDLIHFSGAGSLHFMLGCVAWRARQLGLPLFSQDQGPRRGKWIEEQFRRYGVRQSTAFMVPSLEAQREYEYLGVPSGNIYLTPNGFDPKLFFPRVTFSADEIGGYKLEKPFRILVVARLWKDKDPLTMAEAVCQLVREGVAVELLVVGQGLLRTEVEDRLRQDAVSVAFIEHMAQEDLAERYRSSNVLLLTSLGEGWNCASVEAMACGLPVVASNVRGVREAVGDAGILVPPGNAQLLADALRMIASNRDVAMKYRRYGIERSKEFTWDAVVSRIREIYLSYL
jgi:glycosyltransferase involved in cell wall biosynthesis